MKLDQLFLMQKELDSKIEEQHGLKKEELFDRKVLALQVEVGELANETRCFKFWSLKPSSPKEVILEEYVDGLHFILSLGLTLNYSMDIETEASVKMESVTEQFLVVYQLISQFRESRDEDTYQVLFSSYIHLGELLHFEWKEIEQAYYKKNEVNHERQQTGY
ncbi:dUTP diphosphatase [Sutcliffiella cohnii]|uniref:dUTPase n=1 Tax=Sutcliffiella cohnii TaxID=33932 RepID=A0A223KTN0_9BACI|nr:MULTISPECIES: dUTP diphosphatase [Sutcliffiella]AST92806.1 dUTPase [Sutcliffiella cohnii]MED4016247.1 dUTP diphosphatase [Sutcliffiella cohnii]WBL14061.1 dUTP diphosphatase [Sutcliffiella sp. NC1]